MRRSQGPEGPLPLGLHVLGLPLAFILSQDQTLHCMSVRPMPEINLKLTPWSFYLLGCYIFYVNELRSLRLPGTSFLSSCPDLRVQK